jgi:uroporphyrin-III C-methyltransferase
VTAASLPGTVYFVGAGPGAPDLITLRGARLLEEADIVLHDALVHSDIIALARRARCLAVGKRAERVSVDQRFINRSLVEAAQGHRIVVRLKGGDPTLFGRLQEEIDALAAAGISYQVVPGVTAATAAAAALGVSLTCRGVARSVTFATPRIGRGEAPSDWATGADTLALYMAAGAAPAVAEALLRRGRTPTLPVAMMENATLPCQQTRRLTLEQLREGAPRTADGPALLLVGRVFGTAEAPAAAVPAAAATARSS